MKNSLHPEQPPVSEYHKSIENTKYALCNQRQGLVNYRSDIMQMVYKDTRAAAAPETSPVKYAELPEAISLKTAIENRRSSRDFKLTPVAEEELGTVLMYGNATQLIDDNGVRRPWRPVAHTGGLGSVQVYPIVLQVENIDPGIYHFHPGTHELESIHPGNFREWMMRHVVVQSEYQNAAVALVLTSAVGTLQRKYGPRGYRLGCLDVGHVSQNIYLVCSALGLKVCATNGFIDPELIHALNLEDAQEAPFLVLLLGK